MFVIKKQFLGLTYYIFCLNKAIAWICEIDGKDYGDWIKNLEDEKKGTGTKYWKNEIDLMTQQAEDTIEYLIKKKQCIKSKLKLYL